MPASPGALGRVWRGSSGIVTPHPAGVAAGQSSVRSRGIQGRLWGHPAAPSSWDGVLAPRRCPSEGSTGRAGAVPARGSASRRHMSPRCPAGLCPLHLACPTCAEAATPRGGDKEGKRRRQSDTQGAVTSHPAGGRPQERGEGMLQTLKLRPPPPPRSGSYRLAGGQGSYGNGQLFPQPSGLSGAQGHRAAAGGVLCASGFALFSGGLGGIRDSLWIPTSPVTLETVGLWAGLSSFLRRLQPPALRCPRTRSQEKALQERLEDGLPADGAARDPRSGSRSTPGCRQPPCPASFGAPPSHSRVKPTPAAAPPVGSASGPWPLARGPRCSRPGRREESSRNPLAAPGDSPGRAGTEGAPSGRLRSRSRCRCREEGGLSLGGGQDPPVPLPERGAGRWQRGHGAGAK